jgi:hypothetical protein
MTATVHAVWPDGNQQWLPVTDPRQPIHVGAGEPQVKVPLYNGPTTPDVDVWVCGREYPALTLLSGSTVKLCGAVYPVRVVNGTVYVDAPEDHANVGLALLRMVGLPLDDPELGVDGRDDLTAATDYVTALDPDGVLNPADRADAIVTITNALPQLRRLLGGAS